jgi:hypothetical protein
VSKLTKQNTSMKNFILVLIANISIDSWILVSSINQIRGDGTFRNQFDIPAFLSISICTIFLSLSLTLKSMQLNFAFFWLFQKMFFGYVPFLMSVDSNPYYLARIVETRFLNSATVFSLVAELLVASCQIYLLYFGYLKKPLVTTYLLKTTLVEGRIRWILTIYVLLLPFVITNLGGLSYIFRTVRESPNSISSPISVIAVYQSILIVPPLVCLLTLLYLSQQHNRKKFKVVTVLLFLWVLALSNPLGNARQTTLFMLVPLLYFAIRPRRKLALLFFIICPLILVYSANLVDRYTGRIQMPKLTVLSRHGDFDAFSQLANGIEKVSSGNFAIFHQILGSILFYIPRSFWPDKPYDTGVELAKLHGLQFQNLSAPWILEAYVNARFFGIVVVSILIAIGIHRVDTSSIFDIRAKVIASVISGLMFITLRGSLLQATGRAAFAFFFIFLVFWRTRVKSDPRA